MALPPISLLMTSAIGILLGYMGWELARFVILRLQARHPGWDRTRQRLTWLIVAGLLLVFFNATLRFGIILALNPGAWSSGRFNLFDYVETLGIQFFYVSTYLVVYEGWYLQQRWKQTYREKEQANKAEWQSRFDSLKNQINPHFLFNSLNSLSTLIDESPAQAGQFVDELAKVYRYLLQANPAEVDPSSTNGSSANPPGLVRLADELRFMESYAHLLRTRFGDSLFFQIDVAEPYHDHLLPSLSLQLLVENAVKHNVITKTRPLHIEIKTTETGALTIRNNRQKKLHRVLGTGIGLNNIVTRYRMLSQSEVLIEEGEHYFTVTLPLLDTRSQLTISR